MKEILTADQMRRSDQRMIQKMQVPSLVLMERAALQCVAAMKAEDIDLSKALVVCGSGNNGGDGFAIARMLVEEGNHPDVVLVGNYDHRSEETKIQMKILENLGISVGNSLPQKEYSVIIDAVFGIGLSREIKGRYAEVIDQMNRMTACKVAVDTPSGIRSDDGKVLGTAFKADLTVTFAFQKMGQILYPGCEYTGELVTAPIGITRPEFFAEEEICMALEKSDVPAMLPQRKPDSNKGTYGKVLMITGSKGMSGAAYLSAAAALKCSAGMVKIQTVEANRVPLQTLLPEAMITCDFDESKNERMLEWCDVLVIGPGLGASAQSRERAQWFLSRAAMCGKSVVLDADGLNLLALHEDWKRFIGENVIVTPHIGEMSRLCGKSIGDIQDCLVQTAFDYAKETKAVCVLKDACTVVSGASEERYLNISGNAGMATAGSGDVLSGVIAGVLCMYLKAERKPSMAMMAALGVYVHGLAGDLAAETVGQRGMTAGDIIRFLPEILK